MTATLDRQPVSLEPVPMPERWHRPLLALAVGMTALAVVCGVLALVDPREILGQNAWFKPLKFAVSIAIYAVTLAWLIGQLRRWQRAAAVAGTIVVIALVAEIVIIVWAAAAGTTSHFNVTTPLNTTLWSIMASSIAVVWIVTLLIGIALFVSPTPDAARNLAIRAGVVLGLAGMAVAFLMTGPNADQLDDFQGIAGAHAVGVPDGGAGLPFLGWSTEGGDLRVPHFVGMHALQVLPLTLLALELLSRRVPVLRDVRVRWRIMLVVSLAFAAVLGILTWQALIGQPVIAPAGPVLIALVGVLVAAPVAAVAVVAGARR
ncbi:hypothetical protein ACFUTX_15245 [Microbacterium sp. NPDC057407]|uniref:hypothetical protein n=1 Tax=Microbacterium sp. NPDC057407 TaxID=3346120 RepID=UPI00366FE3CC